MKKSKKKKQKNNKYKNNVKEKVEEACKQFGELTREAEDFFDKWKRKKNEDNKNVG